MMKRAFDILGASALLVVSAPVLIIIAVIVRFSLGTPVLFVQERPGLHGRPFRLFKFRTMIHQRNRKGRLLTDAERLTPLGRFLRSTSLDELPELGNVLIGDMSLVGPRPLLTEYLARYSTEQARRHEVRPGITGWAQIQGRNAISWEEKFAFDVWYADNHSLWLDIRILCRTVGQVLNRRGVSAPGDATMPKFTGTHL